MSRVGALLLLEMLVPAVLVLADLAASAQATAFEFDRFGNIEQRYLCEFSPRLYRRRNGNLTSYGPKMHPWSGRTGAPTAAAAAARRRPTTSRDGVPPTDLPHVRCRCSGRSFRDGI